MFNIYDHCSHSFSDTSFTQSTSSQSLRKMYKNENLSFNMYTIEAKKKLKNKCNKQQQRRKK